MATHLVIKTKENETKPGRDQEPWTELLEQEEWFQGRYLVKYKPFSREFVMADSSDSSRVVNLTDGWHGMHIILTLSRDLFKAKLPHRIGYHIISERQFNVTWQILTKGSWVAEPPVPCMRVQTTERP
jgi:hypothetical protein